MFNGSKIVDALGEEHTVLYSGGVQTDTTKLTLVAAEANKKIVVLSALVASTQERMVEVSGGGQPASFTPLVQPGMSWFKSKKPIYVCNVNTALVADSAVAGSSLWVVAYILVSA